MKTLIFALFLSLWASASFANSLECTAADGTVIGAEIDNQSMIAGLTRITLQKPNEPQVLLPENIMGSLYTNIGTDPNDPVVLSIYDDSLIGDARIIYKIEPTVHGEAMSGSVLIDVKSGARQKVVCVEFKS